MRRHRFNRFGRVPRPRGAVTVSNTIAKKRTKCKACGLVIQPGEAVAKLRLKKAYRIAPCGHRLTGIKKYHVNCQPPDINLAMGFDPTQHAAFTPPPPSTSSGGAVPPPPKPPTAEEAALTALLALEQAVLIRAARHGVTPEMEAKFKTFQSVKARVLRPGTPAEGEVATSVALKRIIDMVYNS